VTHAQLLARCHLKLGQWYTALDDNLTSVSMPCRFFSISKKKKNTKWDSADVGPHSANAQIFQRGNSV